MLLMQKCIKYKNFKAKNRKSYYNMLKRFPISGIATLYKHGDYILMKTSFRKLIMSHLQNFLPPPLAFRPGFNCVLFVLYLQQAGREMSEFTRVPHTDPQQHVTCFNNAKNGISTNHETDKMPPPPAYDVAMTNKYDFKDS